MTSRTRPASSSTNTARTSSTPTAMQVVGLSVAVHRMAALRASRAGRCARPAGADPDQPHDAQHAVRRSISRPTTKRPTILASRAEPVEDIRTSEDVVVNAVGRELYELFFRGYTRKQWGLDPCELDKSVTVAHPDADQHRRPLFHRHASRRCRCDGYTAMFERMLDHPLIEVRTGVDFRDVRDEVDRRPHHLHRADRRIFRLPLRQAALPQPRVRSPDARAGAVSAGRRRSIIPTTDVPYTRISEYKHLTGQEAPGRRSPTNIRRPRATLITRSRAPRIRSCSSATRRSPTRPRA